MNRDIKKPTAMGESNDLRPFFSHQWKDKKIVRRIAAALRADGIDPILDIWEFVPGDALDVAMASNIAASTCFILFWSKRSAHSFNVDFERRLGLSELKGRRDYRVICVALDNTTMPPEHKFRLYIEWKKGHRKGKAFDQNLASLSRAIRGQSFQPKPDMAMIAGHVSKSSVASIKNEPKRLLPLWGIMAIVSIIMVVGLLKIWEHFISAPQIQYAAIQEEVIINSIGAKMKLIREGQFNMGSDDLPNRDDERPVHQVSISKPFYMAIYEVTQGDFLKIMDWCPGENSDPGLPVVNISWYDAAEFCRKLSEKEGFRYRLPTEGEWEYVACGATENWCEGFIYGGPYYLDSVAWYIENSGGKPHETGARDSNTIGIFDILGNVWEWCDDWYGNYHAQAVVDPHGLNDSKEKVVRGGSFDSFSDLCRSKNRSARVPSAKFYDVGFRICRDITQM